MPRRGAAALVVVCVVVVSYLQEYSLTHRKGGYSHHTPFSLKNPCVVAVYHPPIPPLGCLFSFFLFSRSPKFLHAPDSSLAHPRPGAPSRGSSVPSQFGYCSRSFHERTAARPPACAAQATVGGLRPSSCPLARIMDPTPKEAAIMLADRHSADCPMKPKPIDPEPRVYFCAVSTGS